MENENANKKKKKKGNTIVASWRWNRDHYTKYKKTIREDVNTIKQRYKELFEKGLDTEDVKDGVLNESNGLTEKLVLLMIKAEVNSDDYDIEIKEEEVQPIIDKLREGDLLG